MTSTDRPRLRARLMSLARQLQCCGLLLYLVCLTSEVEGLMCGVPGRSENETTVSLYSAAVYSAGQRAEYSCQNGFTLLGDAVRTCQDDGSWSGLRPRCVPNVAYKRPVASSRVVNHYRPDLIVDGDPETCIYLDMRIEDRFIQIDLGRNFLINGLVVHVPDGYVQEVSIFIAEKLESGTGIQYRRCTPSLSRVGAPKLQVECRNEVGVPSAVPGRFLHIRDERKAHDFYFALCEIEIYALPEAPLGCGIPDQPAFAAPINETSVRVPYPNTFDIRCQPGFRRVPENGLLRCVQGQWIGPTNAYKCEAVECDPLAPLINGQIDLFPIRGLSNHSFNTVARHRCSDGYMIYGGDVTRTCGHDGRWTGSPPLCRPVDCGSPRPVANAVYNLVDGHTKPGAIAQYNCFDGYVPQRILADKPLQTSIVCQRSGAWKEGNFYCTPRSTYYYPPVSVSLATTTDKTSELTDYEEEEQAIALGTTLYASDRASPTSTSPRILEIDFVQPTVNAPEDLSTSVVNGVVEKHDETASNGAAMAATGFVVAFILILMVTVGIALNICRMRIIFDEMRKRLLSTAVINQMIKAAESLTKERCSAQRNGSDANTLARQVNVKMENEPVYNELDDRFGLGILFPPPLFATASTSSPISSEEEGTYLDIDLSKNTDMEADSLQSLTLSNKKGSSKQADHQESICPRPPLTSEEVLLLYAKIDKSKKTKNRCQNAACGKKPVTTENGDKTIQPGGYQPSLTDESISVADSPVISKDRSLPRRRDYHPRKVNDLQWSKRVVEVSINEPQESPADLEPIVPVLTGGRPLPPLPNFKDSVVVVAEGSPEGVNVYATLPSD